MQPDDILNYWFSASIKKHWFKSTPQLDQEIRDKFQHVWQQASAGELDNWSANADGCLALTIILDQFPLNMFRGEAKAFSTEQQAVQVARHAIDQELHQEIDRQRTAFLFMPLMHSENIDDQELSVKLFTEFEMEDNLRFARHHRDLIRRFGRFPHRNEILGRQSSDAEKAYLESKHAFKG